MFWEKVIVHSTYSNSEGIFRTGFFNNEIILLGWPFPALLAPGGIVLNNDKETSGYGKPMKWLTWRKSYLNRLSNEGRAYA